VSSAEFDRLAALCAPRGIAIIADEVFADYELEPGALARAGRVATRRDVLSFALGGLSKSVGLPQVKLGWIVAGGPDALVDAALERLELVCDTYLAVSTPVQAAAADLLERGAAIRSQIAARVSTNYRELLSLSTGTPSCSVLPSAGGWYAVMHVPSFEAEEDLAIRLLQSKGVLTHPGYFFDFPRESFLIVSLLPGEESFSDGIGRILGHFACSSARA
jgi:alanine-synthesizing transaminase